MPKAIPHCAAPGCTAPAAVEVYLYDVYATSTGEVFSEIDKTCQFLCTEHVKQNENEAKGERKPRGITSYPFSNADGAQGFSIYRSID
jgi:hypothetical protein